MKYPEMTPWSDLDAYLDRLAVAWTGAAIKPPATWTGSSPSVSVIIPCYNYGNFLEDCLVSVLTQPGVDLDVTIIDDCSTDGSGPLAEELSAQDPRVTLIRHERNVGHIATYNEGLSAAAGDYVVLLSADDMLTPGSLARATSFMEHEPSVGLVYGPFINLLGQPSSRPRTTARGWVIWPGETWSRRRFATGRNVIRSCEAVMRTSVQRKLGLYRPELPQAADLDMWLRAASVSDVGYILGADQAYYRLHQSNMHRTLHSGLEVSGVLRDLHERRETFRSIACILDGNAEFRRATEALATEALMYAARAYAFDMPTHAAADGLRVFVRELFTTRQRDAEADAFVPIEEIVAFALETDPSATRTSAWERYLASREMRDRRSRNYPRIVPDLASRGARKLEHWPWKRLGA